MLIEFNDECTFYELIKSNMKVLIDIYNNQDLSFSELFSLLKLKKS